jgi:hypothetical protein
MKPIDYDNLSEDMKDIVNTLGADGNAIFEGGTSIRKILIVRLRGNWTQTKNSLLPILSHPKFISIQNGTENGIPYLDFNFYIYR